MRKPNYNRIYSDMIRIRFPEKMVLYQDLLDRKELGVLDVIELNLKLFGKNDIHAEKFNQKLRSYDHNSILRILEYQREYQLTNIQLSRHFKLSRNTVTFWKKKFLVKSKNDK